MINDFIEEFNFFKIKENRETKMSKFILKLVFTMFTICILPFFLFVVTFEPIYLLLYLFPVTVAMIASHMLYFTHKRYYKFKKSLYNGSLYTLFDVEKEAAFFSVYNNDIVTRIRRDDGILGEFALDLYDKMNSKEVKEVIDLEINKKRQLEEAYNLR